MGEIMSVTNNHHMLNSTEILDKIDYNHCSLVANPKKPIRLKNVVSRAEAFDSLHIKKCEVSG